MLTVTFCEKLLDNVSEVSLTSCIKNGVESSGGNFILKFDLLGQALVRAARKWGGDVDIVDIVDKKA